MRVVVCRYKHAQWYLIGLILKMMGPQLSGGLCFPLQDAQQDCWQWKSSWCSSMGISTFSLSQKGCIPPHSCLYSSGVKSVGAGPGSALSWKCGMGGRWGLLRSHEALLVIWYRLYFFICGKRYSFLASLSQPMFPHEPGKQPMWLQCWHSVAYSRIKGCPSIRCYGVTVPNKLSKKYSKSTMNL